MAKEKAPAMPFYVREFWDDVNVQAMTWEQIGIYWRLIGWCWTEGSVSNDHSELACSLRRMSNKKFESIWPAIQRCFSERDGRLIQKKVEQIRAEKDEFREKMSDAGKASAAKRASNKNQHDGEQPGSNQVQHVRVNSPTSDFRLPTSVAAAAFVSIDDTGWPEFTKAIRSKFPTTDDGLIRKIVEETVRVYPPVTDENLVSAFMAASESDRKQYSPALYVQTIPRVIKSWIVPA